MPETKIGLVGCASVKLERPARARELYRSQLFSKASAYVEATCDRWYVLSALHGLVHPDTVLEPYNVKLGDRVNGPVIHEWADWVIDQLHAELAYVPSPRLVILAGEQYRTILYKAALGPLRDTAEVPMAGLGIGQQLGWLTEQLHRLQGDNTRGSA